METNRQLIEHYPYDPRVLQFIAVSCGSETDNYMCALYATETIDLIDNKRDSYTIGRMFANVGAQKWSALALDRDEIMHLLSPEDAIIALAMAPYGPSPQMDREQALQRLSEDEMDDLDKIEKMIANLEYSDKLKTALFLIAAKNFSHKDASLSKSIIR